MHSLHFVGSDEQLRYFAKFVILNCLNLFKPFLSGCRMGLTPYTYTARVPFSQPSNDFVCAGQHSARAVLPNAKRPRGKNEAGRPVIDIRGISIFGQDLIFGCYLVFVFGLDSEHFRPRQPRPRRVRNRLQLRRRSRRSRAMTARL